MIPFAILSGKIKTKTDEKEIRILELSPDYFTFRLLKEQAKKYAQQLSDEGAIEINQLSATSRLTIPADYRFRSTKKGIATHIYYERQGKKVDDFSDAEADNYIELNGIKSELVIVEAEV